MGRGVQARTFHRTPLPPATKITLLSMFIEGDTLMDANMLLQLWVDYYVGGGSVVNKGLMSIHKPKASKRCKGMTELGIDVSLHPPSGCFGLELYMSQSNILGVELNKKVTILTRVYYG